MLRVYIHSPAEEMRRSLTNLICCKDQWANQPSIDPWPKRQTSLHYSSQFLPSCKCCWPHALSVATCFPGLFFDTQWWIDAFSLFHGERRKGWTLIYCTFWGKFASTITDILHKKYFLRFVPDYLNLIFNKSRVPPAFTHSKLYYN